MQMNKHAHKKAGAIVALGVIILTILGALLATAGTNDAITHLSLTNEFTAMNYFVTTDASLSDCIVTNMILRDIVCYNEIHIDADFFDGTVIISHNGTNNVYAITNGVLVLVDGDKE